MLSTFKLRCLNGPLTGRDITLPLGSVKLSGHDADLILSFTEAIEVSLLVAEDSVRVVGQSGLWIDGILCMDQDKELPLETVLDLGGQVFVLGKIDTIFKNFSIPERHVVRKRTARPSIFSVCAGLLLFVGALMTVNGFGNTENVNEQAENVAQYTPQWFANQSRQLGLPDIIFTDDPRQGLILSGYCQKTDQLKLLYALLAESGLFYRNQIICHDALLENSRRTLEAYGFKDIAVTLDLKAGIVHVDGDITAGSRWEAAYAALLNVRGVNKVNVSNQQREMFNRLVSLLKEDIGLEGLSVVKDGSSLLVSGEVDASRRKEIEAILKVFNQDSGRTQADFQSIPPAFSPATILPAPVVTYIGTGSNPNIQLENGLRLYAGSVLSNNYVLDGFYPTGISVRKDMSVIFISNLF